MKPSSIDQISFYEFDMGGGVNDINRYLLKLYHKISLKDISNAFFTHFCSIILFSDIKT